MKLERKHEFKMEGLNEAGKKEKALMIDEMGGKDHVYLFFFLRFLHI